MSSPFIANVQDNSPISQRSPGGQNALKNFKLKVDVSRGIIDESALKSPEQVKLEKILQEAALNPIDRQVRDVLKKYDTSHLTKDQIQIKNYNSRIGELRERYEELRWCKVKDGTMESYDRYMQVQGMLKKKMFQVDENPQKQKQELKVALRNLENRQDSIFSDNQSKMSYFKEKYGKNESFVEKQIKRITVEDKRERHHLKEAKKQQDLEAKGLLKNENSSPGLRPSKSLIVNQQRILSKQKIKITKTNPIDQSMMHIPTAQTHLVDFLDDDLETFKHTRISNNIGATTKPSSNVLSHNNSGDIRSKSTALEGYKFGDNSLKHIGSIQKFESITGEGRFLNLHVLTSKAPEEEPKSDENLKLNMRALPEFDRKVLKNMLDKELINKKNVKQSIYDLASAHKPFFNLEQHGSALFAPTSGRLRKQSPNQQVYEKILENVKSLKDHIDVSKTQEELMVEKQMEKEIIEDEIKAVESRKDHLTESIIDCKKKFNRKSELLKSRRNTIAQTEQFPEDFISFPEIRKRGEPMINLLPDITQIASAKVIANSLKKKRDSRYNDERPNTNYKSVSPNPRKTFEKLDKKLNKNTISDAVEIHDEIDKCRDLSKTLELYSTKKIAEVPGLSKSYMSNLKKKKQALEALRDPNFVPNQKFINNSKILQLAFLDKIIEECDEDQINNNSKSATKNFHSFIEKQAEKIKNDDLKIELEIQKEEDFEYQLRFDKSFYGAANVKIVKDDQYQIRKNIKKTIGAQASKGISENSDVFWLSKSRPYSKKFLAKFPQLNAGNQ